MLYAETLTIGLALHLLANYGVAQPKVPSPRGKLTSSQLRRVVDFIRSQPDKDVSLIALAECAHVSPFETENHLRRRALPFDGKALMEAAAIYVAAYRAMKVAIGGA